MAEEQVDHLAVAEEAVRLNTLAIRQSEEGRREQALAAAEEAARLYRALADDFPAMFGTDAKRADALAAAIRDDLRGRASTAVPTAVRQCEPADGSTTAGVSAAHIAGVLGEPTAVASPEPEPPVPPASTTRLLGRSRRRTVVSATAVVVAVLAVLVGAIGVAGWTLSRPLSPTSAPAQAPPPAPLPARPWTATARLDVAPTGVTLRSAPSTAGAPIGRLPAGANVQIQCGEIGRMTSTDADERSSSWLRTTAGSYLAAVNVEVHGPSTVSNCTPGQPPVPLPRRR